MLMIRLSRVGKKKHPTYRVVLQDKRRSPSSAVLEELGHYDPHTKPATFVVKEDRISYWLSQGAKASDTIHNHFVTHNIVKGEKRVVTRGKSGKAGSGSAGKTTEETAATPVEKKEETKEAASESRPT